MKKRTSLACNSIIQVPFVKVTIVFIISSCKAVKRHIEGLRFIKTNNSFYTLSRILFLKFSSFLTVTLQRWRLCALLFGAAALTVWRSSSSACHCFCALSASVSTVENATHSLLLLSRSLYLLGPKRILGTPQASVGHTCFRFLIFTASLLWKSWTESRLSPGNCFGQGFSLGHLAEE